MVAKGRSEEHVAFDKGDTTWSIIPLNLSGATNSQEMRSPFSTTRFGCSLSRTEFMTEVVFESLARLRLPIVIQICAKNGSRCN
jgi:hypothetical protein